jgi:hypothetical protein
MKCSRWIRQLFLSKEDRPWWLAGRSINPRDHFEMLMLTARDIHAKNPMALPHLIAAILRPEQSELLLAVGERGQDAAAEVSGYSLFFDGVLELAYGGGRRPRDLEPSDYPLDLGRDCILPCPWNHERFVEALAFIGRDKVDQAEAERQMYGGNWRQDPNHRVELWLPWRIGFVIGGNHSIAAGILTGQGHLIPDSVVDFDYLFDLIACDGRNYQYGDHLQHFAPVANARHAAVFEIGRLIARQEGRKPSAWPSFSSSA